MLYEVHQQGIPWLLRDWKLLENSIGFMVSRLRTSADSARLTIILYESMHMRPYIISPDKFQHLGLAEVSRQGMIMTMLEYAKSKIRDVRDIDTALLTIESIGIESRMESRKGRIRW